MRSQSGSSEFIQNPRGALCRVLDKLAGSQAYIAQSRVDCQYSTELCCRIEIGNQSYLNLAKKVMANDLFAHERSRWL